MGALFALPFFCCFGELLLSIALTAGFVLWVVAIVDIVQRTDQQFPGAIKGNPSSSEKIIWAIVVIFTHMLGALIYYLVVMKPYPRQATQWTGAHAGIASPATGLADPLPLASPADTVQPPRAVVGTDGEGRVVTYDASSGMFFLAGMRTTIDRLMAMEQAGQLTWSSPETRAWAWRFSQGSQSGQS